jgi:hypothetical protein
MNVADSSTFHVLPYLTTHQCRVFACNWWLTLLPASLTLSCLQDAVTVDELGDDEEYKDIIEVSDGRGVRVREGVRLRGVRVRKGVRLRGVR